MLTIVKLLNIPPLMPLNSGHLQIVDIVLETNYSETSVQSCWAKKNSIID